MKRPWLILGSMVLMVVLAAAAFVGGQMILGIGVAPTPDQKRNPPVATYVEAPELPTTPEDLQGEYIRREGNSFFIGTGNKSEQLRTNADGTVTRETSYDGPTLEIVVNRETRLFKDKPLTGNPAPGSTIVHVVEPLRLEECGDQSTLFVWGERRGDRVIATTLLCRIRLAGGR